MAMCPLPIWFCSLFLEMGEDDRIVNSAEYSDKVVGHSREAAGQQLFFTGFG